MTWGPADYEKKHREIMEILSRRPIPTGHHLMDDLRGWQSGNSSWDNPAAMDDHRQRFYEVMDILEDLFEDMKCDSSLSREGWKEAYDWYLGNIDPTIDAPLGWEMTE